MKPLKADYGLLYNGLEIIFYERISNDYNRLFKTRADDISEEDLKKVVNYLQKPDYDTQDIKKVLKYFSQFDDEEERMSLEKEASREHFFQNFQLDEDSEFGNLLKNTIKLFKEEKGESKFLDSAYDFWKQSYAKKPESIPEDWKPLMEEAGISQNKEDLYKFMFCLETAYAVFARLILAKSGEDYGFPDVEFREFIEMKVKNASYRGDIAQSSYAKITQELIKNMSDKLVSSVFEEDIFYWWTEPFKNKSYNDLFGGSTTLEMGLFGQSLAKMLLMIYKYDFSKIEGDPLGVLYQKYFDKETRKALGEFYTPQEVVDYILDSVEYEGRQVLDKRLLDPGCGSGTFIVTALQRYLEASEEEAEEKGWDVVLDDICNKYRLVGFDIHPFATIMAQIQFMLVLLPFYKKAVEDANEKGEHFTLQRAPIFRTDSLVDESKGEESRMSLRDFEEGSKVVMDIKLPVTGSEENSFFKTEFEMPDMKTVRSQGQLDIHNNEEYFATLQALFDTVKQQAEEMQRTGETENFNKKQFETILKRHYLSDKNFEEISKFFEQFAEDLLEKIHRLQTEFDDGRLIKSIEDIFLAALLKNEQKYDYVVGNPPYVNVLRLDKDKRNEYLENFELATGRINLYILFYERGLEQLNDNGKLGYITPTTFSVYTYGKHLREKLLDNKIEEIVDLANCESVFQQDVSTGIYTISKSENTDSQVKSTVFKKDELSALKKLSKGESSNAYEELTIPQDKFRELPRMTLTPLIGGQYGQIIDKCDNKKKLDDRFQIEQCIRIGSSEKRSKFVSQNKTKLDNPKKIIDAKEIERYEINWNGRFLDYQESDLYNAKEISIFESPKIFFKNTAKQFTGVYDNNDFYALNTLYAINDKEDSEKHLKALLGILNSPIADYWYRTMFWGLRIPGRSTKYREVLKHLPIPQLKNEISEKVTAIKEIKEYEERLSDPANYILGSNYELRSVKLKCSSGHSGMFPSIQQTQDDMYGVIIGKRKKEDPILVDTEEKARFVKLALEGKSVKKDEEIEVLVPKSNSDVKEILEEYEEDKKKLEEMPTVEELEEEINQIVYDLYGLDEEDIEVIEDFLEKF